MKTRAFACLVALSWCVCSGCGHNRKPIHVLVGLDASGSTRSCLGGYTILTKSLAEQLQAGQDQLTFYRVDAQTREFSDGAYDGNIEATLKTLVEEVKKPASKSGTFPARFWQQVVVRVEKEAQPTLVLLMSDGDNDDMRPQAWQQMRAAAKRLAACRQLHGVVFCGARSENWERLRQTFAPLGERLHLLSPTQLNAEDVQPFLEAVGR